MTVINGDAYILRTCKADMTSRGGFVWPREGTVEAPDWKPTASCGNGLHGFLWGEGSGDLADWSDGAVWIVARVSEWVDLGGKVKFPRAEVVFAGARHEATQEILRLGARGAVIGATVSGGDGSTVSGGDGSTVSGGYWSTVSGGYGSTVSGGYGSTVSGGYGSTVSGGYGSTVSGGYWSTLQIAFWDGNRRRIATAYVGENGIKPNTPYRLNDHHEFEEVTQ